MASVQPAQSCAILRAAIGPKPCAATSTLCTRGESMDLAAWSQLGEAVAGFGVIASLVYVAAQIRQNTRSLRAATYHSLVGTSIDLLQSIYTHDEVASIFAKMLGGARLKDLDPHEQARAGPALLAAFRSFDNVLYQYRVGMLDPELWLGYRAVMHSYARIPAWRDWLEANRELVTGRLYAELAPTKVSLAEP